MEWTRVDVRSDTEIETIGSLADLKVGLDTDAESMHREFMSSLPHLSEVMELHGSVVSDVESRVLSETVSTLGEFVSEFGGEWSESEIRLPLANVNKDEFAIDTGVENESQIVRIISPERFGGFIRSFRLPEGRTLSEAIWEGEMMTIKME